MYHKNRIFYFSLKFMGSRRSSIDIRLKNEVGGECLIQRSYNVSFRTQEGREEILFDRCKEMTLRVTWNSNLDFVWETNA